MSRTTHLSSTTQETHTDDSGVLHTETVRHRHPDETARLRRLVRTLDPVRPHTVHRNVCSKRRPPEPTSYLVLAPNAATAARYADAAKHEDEVQNGLHTGKRA